MGADCEQCLPFYVDRPWRAASTTDAGDCKECECNGHTERCEFNMTEYERSGNTSGGVCQDCRDDTRGVHCERCQADFYRTLSSAPVLPGNPCLECSCVAEGTVSNGCAEVGGACTCKNHTHGDNCQLCESYAYGFGSDPDTGCTDCECEAAGTVEGSLVCHNISGECRCKENAMGLSCNTCHDGFWNLDADNDAGCQACECSELGSLSPTCDKQTGQCRCKALLTGRKCDQVATAAFIPNLDHITIEGEIGKFSNDTDAGVTPTYDGINVTGSGSLEVAGPGSVVWSPITVPVSGPYIIVVRYLLDDQVFWRQASLVFERSHGEGPPPSPKLCVEAGSSATLDFHNPVPGVPQTHQFEEEACLRSGITYRLSLNAISAGSGDASGNSSIKIDSVLLIPSWKFLEHMPDGVSNMTHGDCVELRSSESNSGVDLEECRAMETALAQQMQTVQDCDCNAVGSVNSTSTTNGSSVIACQVYGGQCPCKAGVAGRQCDVCMPGYHSFGPSGCTECDCDPLLTVHPNGCDVHTGVCVCRNGVDTASDTNCSSCIDGFRRDRENGGCVSCECDDLGATNSSCNEDNGQCYCIDDVVALDCSECAQNNHYLSSEGCKDCKCDVAGSETLQCNDTGVCPCKASVDTLKCDECTEGTFGLHADLVEGCKPCYCHGHSTQCSATSGYVKREQSFFVYRHPVVSGIGSGFGNGIGNALGSGIDNGIGSGSELELGRELDPGTSPIEIVSADGHADTNSSYSVGDGYIEIFQGDITSDVFIKLPPSLLSGDLLSMYGLALEFSLAIEAHGNPIAVPATGDDVIIRTNDDVMLTFRLDPAPQRQSQTYKVPIIARHWSPAMSATEFQAHLRNVESIAIRTAYASFGIGRAIATLRGVVATTAVYRAGLKDIGVPWMETCVCPPEYTGSQCENCAEGYRRETFAGGPTVLCVNCSCNGYSSSCNATTGECMDCEHNTTGYSCDQCVPGFYGNATTEDCQLCTCNATGTMVATGNMADADLAAAADGDLLPCDTASGQCICKPGVTGRACDVCDMGYYNLTADGCTSCSCSEDGSNSPICNMVTGQCDCIGNVQGLKCDACPENFHNVSAGCMECPSCYGLVLDYMTVIRRDMTTLESSLAELSDPTHSVFSDDAFNRSVSDLLAQVEANSRRVTRMASLSLSLKVHLAPFLRSLARLRVQIDGLENTNLTQLTGEILSANAYLGQLEVTVRETNSSAYSMKATLSGHAVDLLANVRTLFENQTEQVSSTERLINESVSLAADQAQLLEDTEQAASDLREGVSALQPAADQVNDTLHENEGRLADLAEQVQDVENSLTAAQSAADEARSNANQALDDATQLFSAANTEDLEAALEQGQETVIDTARSLQRINSESSDLMQSVIASAETLGTVSLDADKASTAYNAVESELQRLAAELASTELSVNNSVDRQLELFSQARDMKETLTDFHAKVTADRSRADAAEADVSTAADLVVQARRLMNAAHREFNSTGAAVQSSLSTANTTLIQLQRLTEHAVLANTESNIADVNALEAASMVLRRRASQLLNTSRASLQTARANRELVGGIKRMMDVLASRLVDQRQRLASGNQELDSLFSTLEGYLEAVFPVDAAILSSENRLAVFKAQRDAVGFPALLSTLEGSGRELDADVAEAVENLRQANLTVAQLQVKDTDLPTECIRKEPITPQP
ncbi:laminin subunit gamma-1-like [Sycon ciliatum]|uniref:laminin subunit gamma-1-like n=1 Tax=Sycon ciliatum TaxID=27933 RepID=UPI0031F5F43D